MSAYSKSQIIIESGAYIHSCDVVGCNTVTDIKVLVLAQPFFSITSITYLCQHHAETLPIIGTMMIDIEEMKERLSLD